MPSSQRALRSAQESDSLWQSNSSRDMEGRISIESDNEPEKHGTSVRVFLPLQTAYESPVK